MTSKYQVLIKIKKREDLLILLKSRDLFFLKNLIVVRAKQFKINKVGARHEFLIYLIIIQLHAARKCKSILSVLGPKEGGVGSGF